MAKSAAPLQTDGAAPASAAAFGDWLSLMPERVLEGVSGPGLLFDADGAVVAANGEASAARGMDGDQTDDTAGGSGAAYLFHNDAGVWHQSRYLKAPNTSADDNFGYRVALAADGETLAVGADREDSNATGIDGDQNNAGASNSGAVYLY